MLPVTLYRPNRDISSFTGRAAQALIKPMLEQPRYDAWTVQGFGMLRTYLDADKVWRLNVWTKKLAVENVSVIHDHPWDFTSLVVAGEFTNIRYRHVGVGHAHHAAKPYNHMRIQTGEDGGPAGATQLSWLVADPPEVYRSGQMYRQRWDEIHESRYLNGTVTLNERIRTADPDHANVFWPAGQEWVDAEPRPATKHEVDMACSTALGWFA